MVFVARKVRDKAPGAVFPWCTCFSPVELLARKRNTDRITSGKVAFQEFPVRN